MSTKPRSPYDLQLTADSFYSVCLFIFSCAKKQTENQSRYGLYQDQFPVSMRMAGLEPARCRHRQILSLLRLPFRHIRALDYIIIP